MVAVFWKVRNEIIDYYESKTETLEKSIDISYLETAKLSKVVKKYWRQRQIVGYLKELKEHRAAEAPEKKNIDEVIVYDEAEAKLKEICSTSS